MKNPFKGPKSYEENDILYGRDEEIMDLYRSIENTNLTLLYSKSGVGKTSLLNAGFIPIVKKHEEYYPFYFRISNFLDFSSVPSLSQYVASEIISRLRQDSSIEYQRGIEQTDGKSFFETLCSIKITSKSGNSLTPVIILDQFEVIFTLDLQKGAINSFIHDLHCLLDGELPNETVERYKEQNQESALFFYDVIRSKRRPYRFIFSFREEYLFDFEALATTITSIRFSSYKIHLQSFKREVANQVISQISNGEYSIENANKITEYLMSNIKGNFLSEQIDPFLLSVVCHTLWDYRSLDIVKSMVDNALQDYVLKIYSEISLPTRIFIEDFLVTIDKKRTVYSYALTNESLEDTKEIDFLINSEDSRLLSKEMYLDSYHIQIIHDRLVEHICNQKTERETEEKRKEQERQEKVELERKAELEKKERLLKREKRKSLFFSMATLGFFVALIILGVFFYTNSEQSKKINKMLASLSMFNADKAYRDNNYFLAVNTALEADRLLGSSKAKDSLIEGKAAWTLSEYSGSKIKLSNDNMWVGCLQKNQQLTIYYLKDSISSRNPYWILDSVTGFWISNNTLLVSDTISSIVSIYNLSFVKDTVPVMTQVWTKKLKLHIRSRQRIPLITREYIAYGLYNEPDSSRSNKLVIHYFKGTVDTIITTKRLHPICGTKSRLFLYGRMRELYQLDLSTKNEALLKDYTFISPDYILEGPKSNKLFKISYDSTYTIGLVHVSKYLLRNVFESKKHWILKFENERLFIEVKNNYFGIINKGIIRENLTKVIKNTDLHSGLGVVIQKGNPILINKSSLIEFTPKGQKRTDIMGKDSISFFEQFPPLIDMIEIGDSKIHIGNYGVILLKQFPEYVSFSRYFNDDNYLDLFEHPLGRFDLYFNESNNLMRFRPDLKKDFEYWKRNFAINPSNQQKIKLANP